VLTDRFAHVVLDHRRETASDRREQQEHRCEDQRILCARIGVTGQVGCSIDRIANQDGNRKLETGG
jgi:hypothetical protein